MAKRSGMYSSTKRKKELQRQKKQEEKRLKRQKSTDNPPHGTDEAESMNSQTEPAESAAQGTD